MPYFAKKICDCEIRTATIDGEIYQKFMAGQKKN